MNLPTNPPPNLSHLITPPSPSPQQIPTTFPLFNTLFHTLKSESTHHNQNQPCNRYQFYPQLPLSDPHNHPYPQPFPTQKRPLHPTPNPTHQNTLSRIIHNKNQPTPIFSPKTPNYLTNSQLLNSNPTKPLPENKYLKPTST